MADTLRKSITDFCDNAEKWFTGNDILLFIKELRVIIDAHPPREDPVPPDAGLKEGMSSLIKAAEGVRGSLEAAGIELDNAIEQAESALGPRS